MQKEYFIVVTHISRVHTVGIVLYNKHLDAHQVVENRKEEDKKYARVYGYRKGRFPKYEIVRLVQGKEAEILWFKHFMNLWVWKTDDGILYIWFGRFRGTLQTDRR